MERFVFEQHSAIRGAIFCYIAHQDNQGMKVIDSMTKLYFKRVQPFKKKRDKSKYTLCGHNITIACRKKITRNK